MVIVFLPKPLYTIIHLKFLTEEKFRLISLTKQDHISCFLDVIRILSILTYLLYHIYPVYPTSTRLFMLK